MNDHEGTQKGLYKQTEAYISENKTRIAHNKKEDGLIRKSIAVALEPQAYMELEARAAMIDPKNKPKVRGEIIKRGMDELGKAVLELEQAMKTKRAKRFRPDIGEARAVRVATAARQRGISSSKFVQVAVDKELERL